MTASDELYALQSDQLAHDEMYHKDVVIMPLGERMKHMALHNAKYVGYMIEALEANDDDRFVRVLTDAFIIALAAANTMNQDLGNDLGPAAERCPDLATLAREYRPQMSDSPMAVVICFAKGTAAMAKTCESLDHLDDVPYRPRLKESNVDLFAVILGEASRRGIDIVPLYRNRVAMIEKRYIFPKRSAH